MTPPSRGRRGLVAISVLLALGAVTRMGPFGLGNEDAHAVIGRPLTPIEYAGVARLTARRTAAPAYKLAPSAVIAPITSLPADCSLETGIYTCGTARYQPYYDGPTVVYRLL